MVWKASSCSIWCLLKLCKWFAADDGMIRMPEEVESLIWTSSGCDKLAGRWSRVPGFLVEDFHSEFVLARRVKELRQVSDLQQRPRYPWCKVYSRGFGERAFVQRTIISWRKLQWAGRATMSRARQFQCHNLWAPYVMPNRYKLYVKNGGSFSLIQVRDGPLMLAPSTLSLTWVCGPAAQPDQPASILTYLLHLTRRVPVLYPGCVHKTSAGFHPKFRLELFRSCQLQLAFLVDLVWACACWVKSDRSTKNWLTNTSMTERLNTPTRSTHGIQYIVHVAVADLMVAAADEQEIVT
jgi:hypothetical protein